MHTKILLSVLLASVALPAFAADMPVKAPIREAVPYTDWSGIYVGVAAGFGWGREKLDHDVTEFDTGFSSSLFGTGVARVFNGSAALIQNPFALDSCVIDNCSSVKQRGFMAGGFAGAQKQMGNWVLGLEVSFDATGMKKSFAVDERSIENAIRFVPDTPFTVPAQTVTVPGQSAPVTVTVAPEGVRATSVLTIPALVPGTVIPAGTPFPVIVSNGTAPQGGAPTGSTQVVTLVTDHPITVGAGGTVTLVQGIGGNVSLGAGASLVSAITTTGGTGTGTATVAATPILIPAQTITLVGIPHEQSVIARVDRSVSLDTKVDEIADLRGKIGLTNVFFGPNILLYATGGAAIGHFTKTLSVSQTSQVCTTAACTAFIGTARTDNFTSSSGDTRLGWVIGAGLDWKLTPNLVLGALYRHHEFPKGTVSFSEGNNSLGFGTSRQTVDSIQGRLSVLFPIQ